MNLIDLIDFIDLIDIHNHFIYLHYLFPHEQVLHRQVNFPEDLHDCMDWEYEDDFGGEHRIPRGKSRDC